ncbi:hypothetical protein PTTG_26547 [Puccinia triticina 1-1 BBBD Race 1]|uniref:Uncharacterized protein n=1 Tax=Puccinia triticina (isolate 1-1 / race 1 (BBBD)) TaxID=630390 RepID=A0A180GTN2_PUCT1|nr:hypothetical protein PTTG_26547 [Puccinia triticina 1-1 BBBD Race 1]
MVRHSRPKAEQKIDRNIFYQRPGEKGDKWYCHLCGGGGRGSKAANLRKHEKTPAHLAAIENCRENTLQQEMAIPPTQPDEEMVWTAARDQSPSPDYEESGTSHDNNLQRDLAFVDENSAFGDSLSDTDSHYSMDSSGSNSSEELGWDGLFDADHPEVPGKPLPGADANDQGQGNAGTPRLRRNWDWWPFKNKQYLVGTMVIGHTRTIISRVMYNHVRMMFDISAVELPDWTTVRRVKSNLRKMVGLEVLGHRSVVGTPVHTLSLKKLIALKLANPIVEPHIQYYPEQANGRQIYKLSQSEKWLKELGPDTRAQMVRQDGRDYYLHELVQMQSNLLVIPKFFYEYKGRMYARCVTPTIDVDEVGGGLKFIIPKNLPFSSSQLNSHSVADFCVKYPVMDSPDGTLMSTLCGNKIYELDECDNIEVRTMTNPWRAKAGKRVIRHVPISLYSDDTSGNSSKKWNKHISYYFNLAGLPPKLTNQHFHCHFLCTSNSAGALELAEGIVDDIMELVEKGCVAYDCGLGEEVLVTTSLLCFLADTPMHAEITSTVMPNNARIPCRVCDLGVIRAAQKKTMAYLQFFLQISADGVWIRNGIQSWVAIIANCYRLWETSKELRTKTLVGDLGGELGIRDSINRQIFMYAYDIRARGAEATTANHLFTERIDRLDQTNKPRLFNSFFRVPDFDGCTDTPVKVLHVFLLGVVKYLVRDLMGRMKAAQLRLIEGRYRAFNTTGLNIPSLSPYYMAKHSFNFIGKEFKMVLQSAPFVLFGFMGEADRLVWIALCQLAPLVFQTHIDDMDEYLTLLRFHIQKFLYYLFKITGQWANKPKFHMLLHLPESIRRFGPAPLFATKKFESFNGVLRNASVHSNRQSPGKDIATTFANSKALRHLICGG